MTVAELIEELKECPQDAPVCVTCFTGGEDAVNVLWQVDGGKVVAVVLQ